MVMPGKHTGRATTAEVKAVGGARLTICHGRSLATQEPAYGCGRIGLVRACGTAGSRKAEGAELIEATRSGARTQEVSGNMREKTDRICDEAGTEVQAAMRRSGEWGPSRTAHGNGVADATEAVPGGIATVPAIRRLRGKCASADAHGARSYAPAILAGGG